MGGKKRDSVRNTYGVSGKLIRWMDGRIGERGRERERGERKRVSVPLLGTSPGRGG